MSLDTLKKRVSYAGGDVKDTLVQGKLLSMLGALKRSYQSEWVTLNEDDKEKKKRWRCLINPDKLKEDYDQKEISIQFEANLKEGDVIFWDRTNTHWIVFLQEYGEEAYFRASIRRCDYQININDKKYWTYVRGPVETTTQWSQKHQIYTNNLNYSIFMYITKDEFTSEYFKRNQIVKFDGHNWVVSAVDRYSQPSLIEVTLKESYDNTMEDNMEEKVELVPDETLPYIDGPQTVYAFDENISYEIKNAINGSFVVNSNKVKINDMTETSCNITILTGKSGAFDLLYKRDGEEDIVLNVTINSI